MVDSRDRETVSPSACYTVTLRQREPLCKQLRTETSDTSQNKNAVSILRPQRFVFLIFRYSVPSRYPLSFCRVVEVVTAAEVFHAFEAVSF